MKRGKIIRSGKKNVVVIQEYLILEKVSENMVSPELIFFSEMPTMVTIS